ncbi:AMP-binding protein [Streptomyces sp. NPDC093249]|uniref:AMP-binding protein n=1 Tax=unclassified Streptomyces TaxID=2593676 RepID=UPI00344BC30F
MCDTRRRERSSPRPGNRKDHVVVLDDGSSQGGHAVGPHADIVKPLPELLGEHSRRLGDKVCFEDRSRRVTYRELERGTARLAGHLVDLGVARGDRVAVLLGNRVETVESLLAVTRASGVGVPLDPGAPEEELGRVTSPV